MMGLKLNQPIATSRIKGFAENIQDIVDGFFIEPGNVELLVQPLTRLLIKYKLQKQKEKAIQKFANNELFEEDVNGRSNFLGVNFFNVLCVFWLSIIYRNFSMYQSIYQKR